MRRPRAVDPGIRVSPDERDTLAALAPIRVTLEKHVREHMSALLGKEAPDHAVLAEVEVLWTLVLEAFRRGIRGMHEGLHRSEGVDHEMADQAMDYALAVGLRPPTKGGR